MTNAQSAGDSDADREPGDETEEVKQGERPATVASTGSSAVGGSAVGSTDVEPQAEPRPDNDGETIPE